MTRTEAPKDFEGRGWANLARTTPELPVTFVSFFFSLYDVTDEAYRAAW